MTRSHVSLHALILVALVGCNDPGTTDPLDDVGDPSGSTDTTDKISFNGLVLHAPSLARLGTEPLTSGVIQDVDLPLNISATDGLEQSAQGRDLLEYVARCALPRGTNLVIDVGGEFPISYPGHVGLAVEWTTGTCGPDCQGWMTACLLAHANLTGVSVPISLRGSHAALQPSASEMETFSSEEAGFYGNLFAGGVVGQNLFGCLGEKFNPVGEDFDPFDPDLEVVTPALNDVYLENRVCGAGACGFRNAGICYLESPLTSEQLGACAFDGGELGYDECGNGTLFGPVFNEVITVHLQE